MHREMPSDPIGMERMELIDRARGMMVGIGAGNLLGIPWEGRSRTVIARQNRGGVREITAREGYPDDDDLAQAILLAETCIVREPQGADASDAARLVWEDSGRSRAGNGSVMRCGPVALRWLDDDVALARNGVMSAVVTHWDRRCVWSTLLADFAIASCLRGEPVESNALLERAAAALSAPRAELTPLGLPEEPSASVRNAVETALASGALVDDIELDEGIGYAPKALGAVLWASQHPGSVEEGLLAIVNADTNAAPAGAALGARFGLGGIPEDWRARVAEIRAWEAPVDGWIERRPLEEYADRMLALPGVGHG